MTAIPSPADHGGWLRLFRKGWAGRPGVNPGQPFQPGPITGGDGGSTVYVRTTAELVEAAATNSPAWIIVGHDASGPLRERMIIRGNKTIIAPGGVNLRGQGIRIERAMNVAIFGVNVIDAAEDAFEVSESRVVSLVNCVANSWGDGGLDIVRGSTDVSVIHMAITGGARGRKGCLIGSNDRPYVKTYAGGDAHLGTLDDRHTRVWMDGCTFYDVHVRAPLLRHGRALLRNHVVRSLTGGLLVEARTGGRIVWESGAAYCLPSETVRATFRGPDAKTVGQLYVAPSVQLGGARVQTNWTPTYRDLEGMGAV